MFTRNKFKRINPCLEDIYLYKDLLIYEEGNMKKVWYFWIDSISFDLRHISQT